MILRNANARMKVGGDVLLTKCAKGYPSAKNNNRVHQKGYQVHQRIVGCATGVYDLMYEVKTQ